MVVPYLVGVVTAPLVGMIVKPLVRGTIKVTIRAGRQIRKLAAEAKEGLQDMTTRGERRHCHPVGGERRNSSQDSRGKRRNSSRYRRQDRAAPGLWSGPARSHIIELKNLTFW